MISYNKEYFKNNLYFFLKDRGDKISLYYSVADTLTESRKKDEKKEFSKKHEDKLKKIIHRFLNSGKKVSKKQIDKSLEDVEKSGEVDELVDSDGTFLNSKIPFLNMTLHPRKTTDQTIAMSRVTNDPVTRGYRVYWGESEEKDDNVVSEVDYSDAFGYEETKDKDYKDTVKILKNMGSDNAEERAQEMGKSPNLDKKKKKGAFVRQRLSEKDTIEEQQKQAMMKMVEDILAKKSKDDSDVMGKDSGVSKILMKNLQSIKKLAEREGISINQLIKALKSSE
jgi:hypothetical protein